MIHIGRQNTQYDTPMYTAVPWATYGVQCGDVHVIQESQSGRGDGGKRAPERVPRHEQLPIFALLLVERFDSLVHAVRAAPHRVHAIVKALAAAYANNAPKTRRESSQGQSENKEISPG